MGALGSTMGYKHWESEGTKERRGVGVAGVPPGFIYSSVEADMAQRKELVEAHLERQHYVPNREDFPPSLVGAPAIESARASHRKNKDDQHLATLRRLCLAGEWSMLVVCR